MAQERPIFTFHLPDTERKAQRNVVKDALPQILQAHTGTSLELLRNLHTRATQGSRSTDPAGETAFKMAAILSALNVPDFDITGTRGTDIYDKYECFLQEGKIIPVDYERGAFRKIARVLPFGEEDYQDIYRPVQLPLSPAEISGQEYYLTPTRKVDQLMEALFERYEAEKANAGSTREFACALSRLYLIGIGPIHPFPDGNAGAFELFLEAEFLKKGYVLDLPQNERGKIPRGEDLGRAPFMLTRRFAESYGIHIFREGETPTESVRRTYATTLPAKIELGIKDPNPPEVLQKIIDDTADDLSSLVTR